jgi:hypothetical protein
MRFFPRCAVFDGKDFVSVYFLPQNWVWRRRLERANLSVDVLELGDFHLQRSVLLPAVGLLSGRLSQ